MDLWLGGLENMVMGMSLALGPSLNPHSDKSTSSNKSFPHLVYTVISQKLLSMIGGPSLKLMFEVADSG